jgi:hypothetical protein
VRVRADQIANRNKETRAVVVLVVAVVVRMVMIGWVRTALRAGSLGVVIVLVRAALAVEL